MVANVVNISLASSLTFEHPIHEEYLHDTPVSQLKLVQNRNHVTLNTFTILLSCELRTFSNGGICSVQSAMACLCISMLSRIFLQGIRAACWLADAVPMAAVEGSAAVASACCFGLVLVAVVEVSAVVVAD
jgi:hypothetical protein